EEVRTFGDAVESEACLVIERKVLKGRATRTRNGYRRPRIAIPVEQGAPRGEVGVLRRATRELGTKGNQFRTRSILNELSAGVTPKLSPYFSRLSHGEKERRVSRLPRGKRGQSFGSGNGSPRVT